MSKIMQENFRMLDRIKKSRSHYIIQGPSSQVRKSIMAERLADGLVKVPLLLKSIDSSYKKMLMPINKSSLNMLNSVSHDQNSLYIPPSMVSLNTERNMRREPSTSLSVHNTSQQDRLSSSRSLFHLKLPIIS